MVTPSRSNTTGKTMNMVHGIQNTQVQIPSHAMMAKNVDDLVKCTKVQFSTNLYDKDRMIPRVLFNEDKLKEKSKLKIGVIGNFEEVSGVSPTVSRALETAAQILEDNEHEVVYVDIPSISEQCDNAL